MAIARRFQTGVESGSLYEFPSWTGSPSVSTTKYTGTYSVRIEMDNDAEYVVVNIPATRQVRVGCYFRMTKWDTASIFPVMNFVTGGASSLGSIRWNIANQSMNLFVGGTMQDSYAGYTYNVWNHIGIDLYIHSTAGWFNIYKDGILFLSFSGNTGNSDIEQMWLGKNGVSGGSTLRQEFYFDDIYVDDATGEVSAAPCPILQFHYVKPNAVGNYSEWTPSSGSGFETVDETPPSDADYVTAIAVDKMDSYAMDAYTLGLGEAAKAVIPIARSQRGDTTEELIVGTRYSGTDSLGSSQAPPSTFGYLSERQLTKPGGGAWDQAALDDFEAVIKSSGAF